MKKIIEKIKWQERITEYLMDGKYDITTLEHEAIVVISEDGAKIYKRKLSPEEAK